MFQPVCRFTTRRSLLTLVLGSAISSSPLLAQDESRNEWTGQWSASVGLDPFQPKFSESLSENFTVAMAREWSRSNSGLGIRAQLSAGGVPANATYLGATCAACYVTRQRSFAELSGAATWTFRREKSFRPYILGGPALYGVKTRYSVAGAVLGEPGGNSATAWSLGATLGAGVRIRAFGKDLFLEQRVLFTEMSTARRDALVVHPFTLGIRF
jgi:opacity protein-like surface antigen